MSFCRTLPTGHRCALLAAFVLLLALAVAGPGMGRALTHRTSATTTLANEWYTPTGARFIPDNEHYTD